MRQCHRRVCVAPGLQRLITEISQSQPRFIINFYDRTLIASRNLNAGTIWEDFGHACIKVLVHKYLFFSKSKKK